MTHIFTDASSEVERRNNVSLDGGREGREVRRLSVRLSHERVSEC